MNKKEIEKIRIDAKESMHKASDDIKKANKELSTAERELREAAFARDNASSIDEYTKAENAYKTALVKVNALKTIIERNKKANSINNAVYEKAQFELNRNFENLLEEKAKRAKALLTEFHDLLIDYAEEASMIKDAELQLGFAVNKSKTDTLLISSITSDKTPLFSKIEELDFVSDISEDTFLSFGSLCFRTQITFIEREDL